MSVQIDVPAGAAPSALARFMAAFSLRRNLRDLFVRPVGQVAVFDGVRGFFMILVTLYHAFMMYCIAHPGLEPSSIYSELGVGIVWLLNAEFAVDAFFTVSGFLISLILFRQLEKSGSINIKQFYIRRYLRLTPVYYLALLVYWLGHGSNPQSLWANVLYVNNFLHYDNQAMTWAWSLAVEEQFYLVFPLTLMLLKRSKHLLTWLWSLFALSFAIRLGVIVSDPQLVDAPASRMFSDFAFHAYRTSVIYDDFHNRFGAILIGCIAAHYYFYKAELTKAFFASVAGQCAGWAGIAIVLLFFCFPIMDPRFDDAQVLQIAFEVVRHNAIGFGMALIILGSLSTTGFAKTMGFLLGSRFWYPLGQVTYSMYIFHMMVIAVVAPTMANIVVRHPEQLSGSLLEIGLLVTAISYAMTLFVSILSYLFVERPFMNLRT